MHLLAVAWALSLSYVLVVAVASDPCFAKQNFGKGFDIVADENGELLPPQLDDAGHLLVNVRYVGCPADEFHVRFEEHSSRGGVCAVWLDHAPASAGECGAGMPLELQRHVDAPLPKEAARANCTSSLLFAFPPGQRYEYYKLATGPLQALSAELALEQEEAEDVPQVSAVKCSASEPSPNSIAKS
eukprot:TRINITY_DN114552_c0_g1_i1.p1 TRINITY_DN114552_c0_g1~~TRINITY_DN114552_c0_g1_i1.p1  ORF type:complete len:186 (-),score=36.69 TRINITY_DN114552_c0_g1_i1:93-650(-)